MTINILAFTTMYTCHSSESNIQNLNQVSETAYLTSLLKYAIWNCIFFIQRETFAWQQNQAWPTEGKKKSQHKTNNRINLICRKEINIHFLLRLTHIIISFLSLSFQSLLSRPWGKACLKLACNHFNHISKLIKYKQQSSFLLANILK